MREPKRRLLPESGLVIVASVAAALLFGIMEPASAQFFDFFGRPPPRQQVQPRGYGYGGGGGFFAPFQQMFPGAQPAPPQQRAVDYSHAPPPEKRESVPEHNILVLGDAMADWLAYGLEDAYAEQPDMGVIRKHKTNSGLIRYQPKGEPADWVAAAKTILASEKADAIVVMLGLNDRIPIREIAEKPEPKKPGDKKPGDKTDKKDARAKPAEGKPGDAKSADAGQGSDEAATDGETPSIAAPEKTARISGTFEFRDDRWVELYAKKIEDMIAVLKTRGVPVVWVGLPAVRGPKATSDMLFLDALYRDAAGKAGITYVDVWDGFVDESGRFMAQGPDFEGQIRRLRSADGVFFTKAGARKLAHYVEREINRLLTSRTPVALPSEPGIPDVNARPGGPAPRPLAGPIVPLVASSVGTDELLGGPGGRPAAWDALAARTLVKGEPLTPPPGRADDFAWPRRDIGAVDSATATSGKEAGKDPAVATAPATTSPAAAAPAANTSATARPEHAGSPRPSAAPGAEHGGNPAAAQPEGHPPAAPRKRRAASPPPPTGFFGFGERPPPPIQSRPRPRDNAPRPPASIGPAAAMPRAVVVQ